MCTYLQPISNNYIEKGGSESQQKMNIQQEVGHVKKGVGQKDEYPTGGGPCQKRGGLGMSTGIQPGRHEYQLSLLQW